MGTTKDNTETTKDKLMNLFQILWDFELVYLGKIAVIIYMAFTVKTNTDINNFDLSPLIIFATSILIDCIVAGKNVRRNMRELLLFHTIFLGLYIFGGMFVILIQNNLIEVTEEKLNYCNYFIPFCCFSPVLELFYDIRSHLKNEDINKY